MSDGQNPGAAAATTTPPAGGTPQAAGASSVEWTSTLPPDMQTFVQAKGFKDPGAVLESYRNLEKLHGLPPERLLKLPEKADDAEAMNQIFSRLGRPDKPEGYDNLALPEKGDPKFLEFAKTMFHGANLTKAQAAVLTTKWNEYMGTQQSAIAETQKAEVVKETNALKQEWGHAYEQNLKIADDAASKLGLGSADLDKIKNSIGLAATAKFIHGLSTRLGEGNFHTGTGEGKNFVTTPAQAQARIQTLSKDPEFSRRYLARETAAVEEMDRLHIQAYAVAE